MDAVDGERLDAVLDDLDSVEELEIYRRRRAGIPIADEHERHFAGLWPRQLEMLEEMAGRWDVEHDERVRDEIARRPEGYGFHNSLGQLPFDWADSELTHLRPRDWKQARTVRFVRTSRRSVPKQARPRVRSRERRPRVARRTSSSSATSGSDPGGADEGDGQRLLDRVAGTVPAWASLDAWESVAGRLDGRSA